MDDSEGSAASEFWAVAFGSTSRSSNDSDSESNSDVDLWELYESFDYSEGASDESPKRAQE